MENKKPCGRKTFCVEEKEKKVIELSDFCVTCVVLAYDCILSAETNPQCKLIYLCCEFGMNIASTIISGKAKYPVACHGDRKLGNIFDLLADGAWRD